MSDTNIGLDPWFCHHLEGLGIGSSFHWVWQSIPDPIAFEKNEPLPSDDLKSTLDSKFDPDRNVFGLPNNLW